MPCEGTLYVTRGGAYFVHEILDMGYDRDIRENAYRHRFSALSETDAHKWMLTGEVEVFHNPFDEPPEAAREAEPMATLYLRVPRALKVQVEAKAQASGLSANALAIRCLEGCVTG